MLKILIEEAKCQKVHFTGTSNLTALTQPQRPVLYQPRHLVHYLLIYLVNILMVSKKQESDRQDLQVEQILSILTQLQRADQNHQ